MPAAGASPQPRPGCPWTGTQPHARPAGRNGLDPSVADWPSAREGTLVLCGRRHGKEVSPMARHDQQTAPDTPRRLDFSLRATWTAPRMARRALSQLRLPLPLAFDAQLLVSELVSNSVRHAGLGRNDLIRVTADWSGDRLMLHVRDGGRRTRVSRSRGPS